MTSHSFIRREIAGVEAQGVTVRRYTLRFGDETLVDPLDLTERERTKAVIDVGPFGLLGFTLATAVSRPVRFARALGKAIWFGRRAGSSGRGIGRHLIYLAEACVLLSWFARDGVEHVHAHFGTNSTVVALLARLMGGPPFSFTAHGPEEFDGPLLWGLDEKIGHAAFVVAVSEFGKSQLSRWIEHAEWFKLQVVRCGVDETFLRAGVVPLPGARRLVCVGRLAEQKGLLTLMTAAGVLHADGVDFELALVGDGPLRGEIERLIAEYDLGDRVRLLGWQGSARVRELIEGSRALVLPSFAEGLPVVIMEALGLGRPVISTFVAGIPELVQHGESGWLVPASSVESLCGAIQEALDAPVEKLEAMGRAGAQQVAERHNALIEAAKLASLFREGVSPQDPLSRDTAKPSSRLPAYGQLAAGHSVS
jgi:glycosyltransferase involved in cell wall biosynthesis